MSVRLVDNKDTLKKVNDWRDPLYLNNLLTDKEKLIHKKAKDLRTKINAATTQSELDGITY